VNPYLQAKPKGPSRRGQASVIVLNESSHWQDAKLACKLRLEYPWARDGQREIQQLQWAGVLTKCLDGLGHTLAEAATARKSAPWKVAVAAYLKAHTQAGNGWLAGQLRMGSPVAVSHYVATLRRGLRPGQDLLDHLTAKVKACPLRPFVSLAASEMRNWPSSCAGALLLWRQSGNRSTSRFSCRNTFAGLSAKSNCSDNVRNLAHIF